MRVRVFMLVPVLLTLPYAPSLLPFCSAQFDQVEATFENGMLQVKFPKKATAAVVNPNVRVRLPSFLMRPAPLTLTLISLPPSPEHPHHARQRRRSVHLLDQEGVSGQASFPTLRAVASTSSLPVPPPRPHLVSQ